MISARTLMSAKGKPLSIFPDHAQADHRPPQTNAPNLKVPRGKSLARQEAAAGDTANTMAQSYLQEAPRPDAHHRHRDAPPDQQEAGSTLKP